MSSVDSSLAENIVDKNKEDDKSSNDNKNYKMTVAMSRMDLKNWPIFSILEPKFVAKIQTAVVYGKITQSNAFSLKKN